MKEVLLENIESFLRKIKQEGFSESTVKKKRSSLSLFEDWLLREGRADAKAREVKEKDLEKLEKDLNKKGLSEKAIKRHLNVICEFLEYSGNKDLPVSRRNKGEVESDIQKIVNHYFKTKGLSIEDIKKNAQKRRIIYSRYTKPAKDLLCLAGSVEEAKKAIDKVSSWARSRGLDYAIETVFKKWPEIDKLKPKEKKIKPYFRDNPMVWSKTKRKWFVISKDGEWLEFAGKKEEIEWKEEED